MRKQFLVLMLLSLLPFTTWAAEADTDDNLAKLPAAVAGLAYEPGQTPALVTAGVVKNNYNKEAGDGIMYAVTSENTKPDKAAFTTEIPTGENAGTYYVWYYLAKDGDNYNEAEGYEIEDAISVTIAQKPVILSASDIEIDTEYTYSDGLSITPTYTNANLPYEGAVVKWNWQKEGGALEKTTPTWSAGKWTVYAIMATSADHNYEMATIGNGHAASKTFEIKAGTQEWATTPSITSKGYDGSACTVTEGTAMYESAAVTTSYKKQDENDDAYTAIAPTAAGEYTMKVTAAATTNYAELSQTSNFEISRATASYSTMAELTSETLTYNGKERGLVKKYFNSSIGASGVEYKYKGENESEWHSVTAYKDVKATNADTYTVKYVIKADASGNYKDAAEAELGTVTIKQKELTVAALTSNEAIPYGTPITADKLYNAADAGFIASDASSKAEILAALLDVKIDGAEYSAESNYDAGEHTLSIDEKEGQTTNYTASFLGQTGKIVISKADNEWTADVALTATSWNYNGEAGTVSANPKFGGAEAVTYKYAVVTEGVAGEYNLTKMPTDAGTYSVKAYVAETTNYNALESATGVDFTINPIAKTWTTEPTIAGWVYGSNPNTPNAVASDGAEVSYKYYSDSGCTVEIDEPTSALATGTYYVKATAAATTNYTELVSDAVSFEVSAAAAVFNDWANTQGFTYGGEKVLPTISTTDDATITYTYRKGEEGEFDAEPATFTAGTWTVKASAAATTNYAAGEATTTFVVSPAAAVTPAPVALNPTYNGAPQALVSVEAATGAEILYLQADETWSADVPQATNAGSDYTVTYKYVIAENYTGDATEKTVNATIAKKNIAIMLGNKEYDWTGEQIPAEGAYIVNVGELQGEDKIGEGGAFELAFPEEVINVKEGGYTFNTLATTPAEVQNYAIVFNGTAQITVNPVDIVAEDFVAPTAVEDALFFDGGEQDLFVEGSMVNNYGEIQYSTDGETGWSTTLPKGEAADNYSLYWKIVADGNHNDYAVQGPIEKSIAAKGWEANVPYFLGENKVETYKKGNYMPSAANLALYDGTKKLTEGTDYTLAITNEEEEAVTEAINVGVYTFTYTGKDNYAGNEDSWTLTINPKALVAKDFTLAATTAVYNAADQRPAVTTSLTAGDYDMTINGVADTEEEAVAVKDVNEYEFVFAGKGNYTGTIDGKIFTITPAELTITAPSAWKTYNGAEGFDASTTITKDLTIDGLLDEIEAPAGAYSVVESAADAAVYFTQVNADVFNGANGFGNYVVASTVKGTLEIKKAAAINVTFAEGVSFEKFYGTEDDFELAEEDIDVENYLGDVDDILAQVEAVRAIEGENVGTIENAVALQAAEGAAFNNYEGFTVSGTANLTINKNAQKLEITIAPQSKDFDGKKAEVELTLDMIALTGNAGEDTKESLLGENAENLTVVINGGEDAIDADTYDLTLTGEFQNYDVTFVPSTYTINQVELTASVEAQTVATGALVSNIDKTKFTVTGFVNGENAADLFEVQVAEGDQNGTNITAAATDAQGLELVAKNEEAEEILKNYTGWDVTGTLTITNAAALELSRAATDLPAVLEAANGAPSNVTFATSRALTAEAWNGFVLPFDVKLKDLIAATGKYVVVNVLDENNTDANKIKFALKMSGIIAANTPFLLKTDEASNQNEWVFEGVQISYPGVAPVQKDEVGNTYVEDAAGNKFFGVYAKVTGLDSKHFLFNQGTYLQLNGNTVNPLANYLEQSPNATQAPVIYVEEMDGSTTAINAVSINGAADNDGWYNVNGMKRNNAPAQKGVYIKNGKKVIVK